MSVGVDCGEAYAGVVGSSQRMELLVSGPGIHGATHAEESGDPGQVILGERAYPIAQDFFRLEGRLVIDNLGDDLGAYEVLQPKRKAGGSVFLSMDPVEVLQGLDAALSRVERLAPFLPEDMLAQMVNTDRHRRLESELRPVAVQFINVVGIEDLAVSHSPELATAVFQQYFVQIQEIIKKHEGIVSQIDAYSQGFFLLNTFGVPKTHEGTRRYAVSAALQMAKALEQVNQEFKLEKPIQQRGGITYGLIFSGEIGAQYRRESFVGGPAVNRAARLMSKAAFGQVILDSDIWAEIRGAFVGESLPAVHLKGIEGPVVIVNVRQVRRGTRLPILERPLLGREAEQRHLQEALENLTAAGQGSGWLISGESGIGKTSLIADLAGKAKEQGLTVLYGRCQPHRPMISQ
jgi:class 3 adenylate cyclase